MSSKRKCIVILLFIVIVSILFILYNRSQFFFGIYNHCKYSVYKLHSKSFKNQSNLLVNRTRNRVNVFQKYVKDMNHIAPLVHRYDSKLIAVTNITTTELPLHPENSPKLQNIFLTLIGMRKPRKFTKYKECPQGRILTALLTGKLGNVVWEYMSLIAVEELYSDQLNMQAFLPGNMKKILDILFERIDTPQIVDLPASCISMRHAQLVGQNANPKYEPGAPYVSPILLDKFSCRYNDVIRYGVENIRAKLRFKWRYIQKAARVLMDIKANFSFKSQDYVTFVGVHYRGGNYNSMLKITYPQKFKESGPPSIRYYKNAMQYFNRTTENVIFVLISIEEKWIKKNVPFLHKFNVVVNPSIAELPMISDFILLSLCNHSIINYGTYGSAAALFAGGTTLVYDMNLPQDGRGYSLAVNIAHALSNWFLCSDEVCFIKQ